MQKTRSALIQQLTGLTLTGNLIILLKALAVTTATLALYFYDLSVVFTDAINDESATHVLVVPIILAYLVYRKRNMLRAVASEEVDRRGIEGHFATLGGILLCATAVILYWYGSYSFTPLEYHILTLPIFVAGLILVFFNPRTLREAAFPVVFLVFLTPPPSQIVYGLGSTLSVASSEASNAIIRALGIKSVISSQLGTPAITITRANSAAMTFTVGIACSGIYSLTSFLIFAAFTAYLVRDKPWKKAAIFLVGFPLIYLLNITRVTSILLIGYQWGEQLALDVFHQLSGWVLIFIGTLILLLVTEKLLKVQIFSKRQTEHRCSSYAPSDLGQTEALCLTCGKLVGYVQRGLKRTDILKIVTIGLTVILLLSIRVPLLASAQGPSQLMVETPNGLQGNIQILPEIPGYTLQFVFRDTEFEQMAEQDFSLIYSYAPNSQGKQTVWVALEVAGTKTALHPWEYCLVSWPQTNQYQPTVSQLDLRDTQVLENPLIIARYFAFQYKSNNQTQLVLYWFETSIFSINNSSQQKYVKISLITYPETPNDVSRMEDELLPLAIAIANYWQPIKTWNTVALVLSRNGFSLASFTTILLGGIIVLYASENRKRAIANTKAYERLSPPNKQIIDIISEKQKNVKPTLPVIVTTYKDKTGRTLSEKELLQKLSEIEKTGIIRSRITSFYDEPFCSWKTQMAHSFLSKVYKVIWKPGFTRLRASMRLAKPEQRNAA